MLLKVLVILSGLVAIAMSIPMPFREEVPSDEIVPFAPYTDDVDGKDYRLPNNTKPIRYDVSLSTDVHRGQTEFVGTVKIRVEALENTNDITIHYRQLTIETIEVFENANDATGLIPSTSIYVDDLEFLTITVERQLLATRQYLVVITYHGLLRDDNMGFYRSSYKDADGKTVWLATTQFEQTDARHAFPCYDEPQIRTPFGIEIKHDSSFSAISNMPVVSNTSVAGTNYVLTKFQDTLPVQTYLIAFIVSDFASIGNNAAKPQRVYAKSQSIDNNEAVLALNAGELILEKFVEHLGVSYNLPKIDQVALPDFDAGAMENWGLVTYREEYLLYNEEIATTRQRENILTIIAHEYAHQWFGNHVAPKWWSVLWLNEGFATLYENYLASLVYPEDRLMDTFVIDTVQTVLDTDANPSIRPMTYYVESPERITGLFDRVAYDKSGSVLRMMQVALGIDTWTKGLRNYLLTKQYDAATPDDLYSGIQQAVNQDYQVSPPNVATIMRTWENQAGYPVVTVSRSGNTLTLSQDRFFYTEQTSSSVWWIPINYVVGSNPNFTVTTPDLWMPGQKTVTLQSTTAPKSWTANDWIVLNIQESSYFRVNYDDNLWNLLIEQLKGNNYQQIHLLNRAQLVDDSLNLARAGRISYDVPFSILEYLTKEVDYIPWASANRGMTLLNRWLIGSPAYESYQTFVKKIVEPLYNRLGVEVIGTEHKLERYARSIAINLACQAGLSNCLTQSAQKLQQVINNGTKIAPDLQSAIYCNGLRQSNSTAFFYLQNKMFQSEDQAERTLIINALGCAQDATLLSQYLNLAILPGDALRLQEKFRVLVAPVNNGELGLRVMMEFIRYNFHAIIAISPTQVNTMLSSIASRIASQDLYNDFNSLLTLLQTYGGITESDGQTYRASANENLAWRTKNLGAIESWFKDGGTTSAPSTTTPSSTTESTTLGAGSVMISTFSLVACVLVKYLL